MRKFLSLILCAAMLLSCVAVASADEAVKTGLSVIVNLTSSKNATAEANGVAHSNIQLVAVTVDANGVIDDCVIDYIQAKINFNAAGEIVTEKGTVFASKIELDDAYVAAVKKQCPEPQALRDFGRELKLVYTPLHGTGMRTVSPGAQAASRYPPAASFPSKQALHRTS